MMMKKLFEAAFQPPAKGARDAAGFAVLPRQSEDELVRSEVHTKLDRALAFLQQEIGFSLLDDARPRPGGGVRFESKLTFPGDAVPREARSTKIPVEEPAVPGVNDQDSDRKAYRASAERAESAKSASDVIRLNPDLARYAHYPEDLELVWRFATILGESSPSAAQKVNSEALYRTVLQALRLMHLCKFSYSDVVLTLAYASVYFRGVFVSVGSKMSEAEVAHVCVLLIYLAHSFLLDENCPLRYWHQHIFRKYCTLKVLDAALFRLFRMTEYVLRVSKEEEKYAIGVLQCLDPRLALECRSRNTGSPTSDFSYGGEVSPPGSSSDAVRGAGWVAEVAGKRLAQHRETEEGDNSTADTVSAGDDPDGPRVQAVDVA